MLTVYARNNKSATVFLGGELRSAGSPVTKKQLSLIKREVHHYIHDRSHVDYRTESAAPMADVARTRQSEFWKLLLTSVVLKNSSKLITKKLATCLFVFQENLFQPDSDDEFSTKC